VATKAELRDWLDRLAGTPPGKIKLTNIFLAYDKGIVDPGTICSFLTACVDLHGRTAQKALSDWNRVCKRNDRFAMLLRINTASLDGTRVATTMSTDVFTEYILNPVADPILLRDPSPIEEGIYRRALGDATSFEGWSQSDGTLGTGFPNPRHIWLTELAVLQDSLDNDPACITNPSSGTRASTARDLLGLIDAKDEVYLLSIHFKASCLQGIPDVRLGRPTFADPGSSRFATYLDGAQPRYDEDWGVTVHLGKVGTSAQLPGVPERVCSFLPLDLMEPNLAVEAQGRVAGTRGLRTGVDDDDAYVNVLRNGVDIDQMKSQLAELGV